MDCCHFAFGVGNCGADDGNSGVGVSGALQMDGLGNYVHRPIDLGVLLGPGLGGQDAGRQGGCIDRINGSVLDPSRSRKECSIMPTRHGSPLGKGEPLYVSGT